MTIPSSTLWARPARLARVAVDEEQIKSVVQELRMREGIDAGREGGAALLALRHLFEPGATNKSDLVVVFNTGGNKYRGRQLFSFRMS